MYKCKNVNSCINTKKKKKKTEEEEERCRICWWIIMVHFAMKVGLVVFMAWIKASP
jgi:hypothetical protein